MTQPTDAKRSLAAELTSTTVATAVIMAAGIVTGLLAARALGPAGRGELTASTIWPSTLLYAGTFGLSEATAYFTASRRDLADHVFLTAQVMALVLGVVVSVVGWFVLPLVLAHHPPALQANARLYLLLFAVPCLSSLSACAWLQGAGHLRWFNISRVMVHATTAVAMAAIFLSGLASVRTFLGAMLLGNSATWILAVVACVLHRRRPASVDPALVPQLFSYGSRVQLGSWSAAANVRLDQLMLASMATSAPLGLYVVAISYAGLVVAFPNAAAMVMLPRVVGDCAIGRGGETLTTWYRRLLWATVAAGLTLWIVARVLLPLLFGEAFRASLPLVTILIPASCILGMNQLLATGFRGHGRPGTASRAELLGLVVTVPLLLVLLPRFGVYGAAVTSLCAYSSSAVYLLMNTRSIASDLRSFLIPTTADWLLIRGLARSFVFA